MQTVKGFELTNVCGGTLAVVFDTRCAGLIHCAIRITWTNVRYNATIYNATTIEFRVGYR